MIEIAVPPDPLDARIAFAADGMLAAFNRGGIITAGDMLAAERIATIAGEHDEPVRLAIALTVRGTRLGHVRVDLAAVPTTAEAEDWALTDEPLPWPDTNGWLARVAASPAIAGGEPSGLAAETDRTQARPLRLIDGRHLYLDRMWVHERRLADALRQLGASEVLDVDEMWLREACRRLFTEDEDQRQRLAAASAVIRRLTVIAGGPGTGKTTTVARTAALLSERAIAGGGRPPLIALCAPTGKAAARLEQAVHAEAAQLAIPGPVRDHLHSLTASTIHRLLGRRPDSASRFRHHAGRRLPHDVVIVDETSMVSLPRMRRLIEALRPQARLILVGDPGQLASIEAGAVLGDIVGPAADALRIDQRSRRRLEAATGDEVRAVDPPLGAAIANGIVVLRQNRRFGGALAELAEAVRIGDGDRTLQLLRAGHDDLAWIEADDGAAAITALRGPASEAARTVGRLARAGDAEASLRALEEFRLLCAHRQQVAQWNALTEEWLGVAADEAWYPGRPLLITENDYELGLFNGDSGVVVDLGERRLAAAFERRGEPALFAPSRLAAIETVYAMTIHKSQGSQFATAAVVLPAPEAPILTRELLYTAVTRAQRRLIVVGTEDAVRTAIARPVARGSGLRRRLWGTVEDA